VTMTIMSIWQDPLFISVFLAQGCPLVDRHRSRLSLTHLGDPQRSSQ